MEIRIKETGEMKTLNNIDSKGQDWKDNIIGSKDVFKKDGVYTASEEKPMIEMGNKITAYPRGHNKGDRHDYHKKRGFNRQIRKDKHSFWYIGR